MTKLSRKKPKRDCNKVMSLSVRLQCQSYATIFSAVILLYKQMR